MNNGGIDTGRKLGVQAQCNPNRAKIVTIDGYHLVPRNNEKALEWIVAKQPVSVSIEARGKDFQMYKNVNVVDHSVVTVGYCSENGLDYWIARNSWGPNWGEGYMRIRRNVAGNRAGECGLAQWDYYPTKKRTAIPNSEKVVCKAIKFLNVCHENMLYQISTTLI